MNILLTGASGTIGSALSSALTRSGHSLTRAVRRPPAAEGEIQWRPEDGALEPEQPWDAVIHLAGESLASGRWNGRLKRRAWESRVPATRRLCERLARLGTRPKVLLAASAMGYYGDRGEERLDESSTPGSGFLAEMAQAWEAACEPARSAGMRVVHLRFGIVLAAGGGALPRMALPARLGLGGPLGRGDQYWSWISIADVAGAALHALARADLEGPVNLVAPEPVKQREFARTLGRVLRRPAVLPAPAWALRLALGEMADPMLLASARLEPARLRASGFVWRHPQLDQALAAALPSAAGG